MSSGVDSVRKVDTLLKRLYRVKDELIVLLGWYDKKGDINKIDATEERLKKVYLHIDKVRNAKSNLNQKYTPPAAEKLLEDQTLEFIDITGETGRVYHLLGSN